MGKQRPAHEIKLGKIRVAIWANETEDHKVWFNAVVTRLYKSGDSWKEISSFRRDDMPVAMKALDMAWSWIWQKEIQLQRTNGNAASEELADSGR